MADQVPSNTVSMSPELADKAHTLMCEIVGAWNTGGIVTHEVRGAVRQWLIDVADHEQRASHEPGVTGVKCVHCNGSGEETQVYDEQNGWSEEKPCDTCKGSGRITTVDQYLKTVPANWHENSSLETWFPCTAAELKRLEAERTAQPPPSDAATVTRLPARNSYIAPISDRVDDLVRELQRQGMVTLRATFDGYNVRIDPQGSTQPPEADLLREIRSSHEQLRNQAADRGGVYQKCQCRYCATPTKGEG